MLSTLSCLYFLILEWNAWIHGQFFVKLKFLCFAWVSSWQLLVQSEQWKYQKNMWNLFKGNKKENCVVDVVLVSLLLTTRFFIRKIFIRKWSSKTPKPYENFMKITSLLCLSRNFQTQAKNDFLIKENVYDWISYIAQMFLLLALNK